MEDNKLISLCLKGDRIAQELLYKTYRAKLMGICVRYAKNLYHAEDIFQEAMIKVFQNLGQLKDKSALEFWAKRIVIRCAVNYYEGNKNHFNYVDYDHVMDLQNDDYHFLIDQLESDNLVRLISELPNSCRMVFNLFVLDGLSHKEIAEFLSISVNTSKSQLFYAKLLLKKALKKEDYREDVKPKLKKYV